MKLTEDELKLLIRKRTSRSARGTAECLDPEVLSRAAARDLSKKERDRVVEHLRSCSDCAREYRVAHSLKPWLAEVEALTEPESPEAPSQRSSWRAVTPVPIARRWSLGPSSNARLLYGIAASILLILAVGAYVAFIGYNRAAYVARLEGDLADKSRALQTTTETLERTQAELRDSSEKLHQKSDTGPKPDSQIAALRELSAPQLNLPIVDLDPASSRGGSDAQIEIPAYAASFIVILHTSGEQSATNCGFEILDSRSRRVASGNGLRRNAEGTFTMSLSRRTMPRGRYHIRLFPSGASSRNAVGEYVIVVK